MGTFDVICGISKLPISEGDSVVFIPLVYNTTCQHSGVFNASLRGIRSFYSPATLPIFGTYDGCGRLENIEYNINTDLIHSCFSQSVDEFTKSAISGKGFDEKMPPLSGMFVNREVYEFLCKPKEIAHGLYNTAYHLVAINPFILKSIGFIEQSNKSFIHPKISDLIVEFFGAYEEMIVTYDNKIIRNIRKLIDLDKFLQEHKLYIPLEIEHYKFRHYYDVVFDINHQNYIKFKDHKFDGSTICYPNNPEFLTHVYKLAAISFFDFISPYHNSVKLLDLYKQELSNPIIRGLIVSFHSIETAMYDLNVIYMPPAFYVPQSTTLRLHRDMASFIHNFTDNRIVYEESSKFGV